MRVAALLLAAAFSTAAVAAAADPRPVVGASALARQCLDPSGRRIAPSCRRYETSRLATEPDICVCGPALREVRTPYCAPSETPAPDSAAADRARLAALKRGDLDTARFEGRRFCEPLADSSR